MKTRGLVLLLVLFLLLAACAGAPSAEPPTVGNEQLPGKAIQVEGGSYRDVSVSELEAMLASKDFQFINVHIPFEGDIPDTDLSIPFDQIAQNLDKLPADKNAKIVLYCRSDRMSNIAAKDLVRLGYTNVWNLDGGFNAWEAAGLPLNK
jgi:rhodanese-related sulfurtransferase